ncbi:hypothetical protein F0P96_18165 [Hymenobacter busanensis]|uniref:Uncharacterized protein n=1 Tax=Hymenobacter busanensis TaxID=2607656 RepID=A0A7L4ZS36_9BACT|nr:hypothetical protein [Hymenobacter busanensis]KAA9327162.1 hypothetical protein F0P96_18165 [Hymenobacter busanensis]QHJ05828.1 hypothetical protein GUY19_00365 [Hymenobacter busanensis]
MPSYYVHVKPAGGATRWEDGLELVTTEADSLEVRMGVAATAGEFLEFDVAVRNRSSRPVLVAPEQFYLLAYYPDFPSPKQLPATNPETTIETLQQKAAEHEKQSTALPAAEVLAGVNNTLADLTTKRRNETTAQYEARNAAHQAEKARHEQQRTAQAVQAVATREQLAAAEESLLRKTTLNPGYAARGRVRFQRYVDAATRLRVVVPVAGHELAGDFIQTRFTPNGRPLTPPPPTAAAQSPAAPTAGSPR